MTEHRPSVEQVFAGNSEMAMLMRSYDWSQTALGAVATWPQSLKTCVRIVLTSQQAMFVWWGDQLINLYNDAYRSILGGKHPEALGQPASVVWREIWQQVGPRAESAMQKNEGTYDEALLLIMERNGYPEETYYTFSYSPVPNDQGGTGGIICANTDDTQRVISERQLGLLRELATKTADARTFDEACSQSAKCLETNPYDLPFAMIYLVDADQRHVTLAGTCGIDRFHAAVPEAVDLTSDLFWPFAEVLHTRQASLIADLAAFPDLPTGAWRQPLHQAVAVPIAPSGQTGKSGILIVGLNPFRLFDSGYRGFIDLIAAQISASIANAQAYEEERKRAEALAELDRAKTAFFSNVSHEFRTPLTLMLSPLEELAHTLEDRLQINEREQLQLIQRNGLRLQKLVNTLLDFSRIEAGRIQAVYEPTDLSGFTAELASVFRSLIERAGMTLTIDCSPLPELVYIDRDMWEKVVLNLISNAFKFTFTGGITIRLRSVNHFAELSVEDTGVGIPEAELPRLFERFHRVSGTRSRTYEGSGIGLALVQELVNLHKGTIHVSSHVDRGTTFTISLPFGSAHLPAERIRATRTLESTALGAIPFVEEASRWLPEDSLELVVNDFNLGAIDSNAPLGNAPLGNAALEAETVQAVQLSQAKILLADDNADMRDYVKRLLSSRFQIATVINGAAALQAVQTNPPDLVLSDVMMPEMDGFELLRSLRANPATQEIPIILLSARAGEEARIEGLQAGADDYLTKPFSARELIARVEANLKLAQLRRETTQALQRSEERYRAFVQQSSEAIWRFEVESPLSIHCFEAEQIQHFYAHSYLAECNQVMAQMYGAASVQELLGVRLSDLLVPSDPRNLEYLRSFIRSGYRLVDAESYEVDQQGNPKIFLNNLIGIVEDEKLVRAWGMQRDITERKQAEVALQERKQRLDIATSAAGLGVFEWNAQTDHAIWENQRMYDIMGLTPEDGTLNKAQFVSNVIHPDDRETFEQAIWNGMQPGNFFNAICRIWRRSDQQWRWVAFNGRFILASSSTPLRLVGVVGDITDAKQAEAALRRSEAEFRQLANSMPQVVWIVDAAGSTEFVNNRWIEYSGLDLEQTRDPAMMQQIMPPEDFQQIQADFAQAQASGSIYQSQFRLIQPDGGYRYFLTRAIPIKNDQGQVQKWYGTSTDITELKQLEAERAELLQQEQAAREVAEQANRIKDEFLAVLSHELRSPLNPILGWARLLQQGQLDATRTATALATIERNAKLQAQLIDDLLDISRILRGKLRLEVTLVDLASVITAALDTVRLAAEAKNMQIQTLLSPVGQVNGDAGRLQQVVWNLLSNAVKFTPAGGQITVTLTQAGSQAQIQVSDTGKGIKADFLPYVFEHFRQEDGATTRKFGGLGLGLAIVRQIVELHGGTVGVTSPGEGQGATFTVQIPLALRCEQRLPPASALPATRNLTHCQILLVDDELDSREFVSFVLEQVGASVTSVASGIEALQKVEQMRFDLLISDIGMPDIDGYMLIQQIRALGYRLPAIALTAYASEYDQQQALAAGFQQHIAKPIDPEMLISAASTLCHNPLGSVS